MEPAEMQSESKESFWRRLVVKSRFFRLVVGWICVLIGVSGIILPILPGIPFLVAGLALLSTEHRWVRRLLVWTKRKLGRWWPRQIQIPRGTAPRRNARRNDRPL